TVAYSFLLPRPAYAKASAGWRDAHMSAEDLACLREAGASLRRRQGEGGAGRACPALNAGCPVRFLCPRRSWVLRAYAGSAREGQSLGCSGSAVFAFPAGSTRAAGVVGGFAGDDDIVHVAFAHPRAGDAHELRALVQFVDGAAAGIAHRR